MHLKHLKLAGFKSFVEPTTLSFPSRLVGVVGPNGCGKSNVIDAVRWVMGESVAKTLRGESMTDVIFKGSSHKKPLGQASVELVFDHQLGRLSGPFASYQEISVKRLVTRDGDSSYFLNGSRCRRRDITDLFLGTGAGARGYSIIGQDTISRLIVAHPDDLRAYIEEAAGVSKYKERRRETVVRIEHTRENLARLLDLREELDQQVIRLEQQAASALRYSALKQEERLCRADILALKWRTFDHELSTWQTQSETCEAEHLLHQAHRQQLLNERDVLRENTHQHHTDLEKTHAEHARISQVIHAAETLIQQRAHEKQRLVDEKKTLTDEHLRVQEHMQQHQGVVHESEKTMHDLHVRLDQSRQALETYKQQAAVHQQRMSDVLAQGQHIDRLVHQSLRDTQVKEVHQQHAQQRATQLSQRLEMIVSELKNVDAQLLNLDLTAWEAQHCTLQTEKQRLMDAHEVLVAQGVVCRDNLSCCEKLLHETQDQLQTLMMEHATLQAQQQAALHHDTRAHDPMWDHIPRVIDVTKVMDPWSKIADVLLENCWHALVVSSVDDWLTCLPTWKGQSLMVVQPTTSVLTQARYPRFLDYLEGVTPLCAQAWEHIFAASNLEEALRWRITLQSHESIVTPDGYWLGVGWLHIFPLSSATDVGLVTRQKILMELHDRLTAMQSIQKTQMDARDHAFLLCRQNDEEHVKVQKDLTTSTESLLLLTTQLNVQRQKQQHERVTQQKLRTEHARMTDEFAACMVEIEHLKTQHVQTQHQASLYAEQHQMYLMEKNNADTAYHGARQTVDDARTMLHQLELQHDRARSQYEQACETRLRLERQQSRLQERLVSLESQWHALSGSTQRDVDLELHEQRVVLETVTSTLTSMREKLTFFHEQDVLMEQRVQQAHVSVQKAVEQCQHAKVQTHVWRERVDAVLVSFTELNTSPEYVLQNISEGVTIASCEEKLHILSRKIQRLGAINLLAVDEYQVALARKERLDEQYEDLMAALETLELAIKSLDKDTQQRFHETYTQVNEAFQRFFPRLFGGGHAQLQLNCDNLLEAGIVVMAQPPGKRNSTIHMLSGGEKALTAVALVFAIFQLNPSPFCLLDEVDAPLDDTNVRRFCELVKEMSECVQFLFITHNKTTMMLAEHLIGVTMQEPGVSCLVAVDVAQTLEGA